MNTYSFFWKDGRKDILDGDNPANALNNAGYGGGAVAALDFYSEGDSNDYEWNSKTRYWDRKPIEHFKDEARG